jgi:hypothetical protein
VRQHPEHYGSGFRAEQRRNAGVDKRWHPTRSRIGQPVYTDLLTIHGAPTSLRGPIGRAPAGLCASAASVSREPASPRASASHAPLNRREASFPAWRRRNLGGLGSRW